MGNRNLEVEVDGDSVSEKTNSADILLLLY